MKLISLSESQEFVIILSLKTRTPFKCVATLFVKYQCLNSKTEKGTISATTYIMSASSCSKKDTLNIRCKKARCDSYF